jgi:2-polyprenyl-6-methoxyphenol hydroxylase-like FAD-dependent oxidoreductase
MPDRHFPVLIAGGSLTGLSTSTLLAWHGVPHLMVESHTGTAIHPRAASFHQRTMEIFRSVGLQRTVEEAAAAEFRQNGAIIAVESLGGKELKYFYRSYNDGVEGLSPTSRLFITQTGLEPLLRRRAADLGAEHMFGTDLVSFTDHGDHVTSVIRPRGGPEQTVTSDYLVAADGAHSPVRERLGIAMTGHGSFADCLTIYFKAEVAGLIGDRNLSVVYVNHPELLGFFRFSLAGDSGFLAVFATFTPDGTRETVAPAHDSPQRCAEMVRTALGAPPGLPIGIENVQRWSAAAATAERFHSGRVFLAGDSAHVMPPTGGFGGNTGVADAHNLAWKLASVLHGHAGPGLLDTYDAERRPAAALTVEQAYTRYVVRVDPSLPQDGLMLPLDDAAIELGAVYQSAAVHQPDGRAPEHLDDPHAHTWTVGTRVPHAVLSGSGGLSTLDAAGRGFTVLAEEGAAHWRRAAELAQGTLGVPVTVVVAGPGDIPRGAGYPAGQPAPTPTGLASGPANGTGQRPGWTGAALLRPDGIIAWKPTGPAAEAAGQLTGVLAGLLSASTPAP